MAHDGKHSIVKTLVIVSFVQKIIANPQLPLLLYVIPK